MTTLTDSMILPSFQKTDLNLANSIPHSTPAQIHYTPAKDRHLGESWSEMGGLAWIPARPSDKPLSARRLRQDDSGDIASRQRFHDHEPVRQGRGIGCSGRDAGLRSGFYARLCNGSGFGPIYGCCTMMKINTFLMRRDV